jgi:hypothetical protein
MVLRHRSKIPPLIRFADRREFTMAPPSEQFANITVHYPLHTFYSPLFCPNKGGKFTDRERGGDDDRREKDRNMPFILAAHMSYSHRHLGKCNKSCSFPNDSPCILIYRKFYNFALFPTLNNQSQKRLKQIWMIRTSLIEI